MIDVLGDVLNLVRLSGTVYFQVDFACPWGMKMNKGNFAQFHIVTEGECWVKIDDSSEQILLHEGDIVAFPHGDAHWLADNPESKMTPGHEVFKTYQENESAFQLESCDARLVCGHFEFSSKSDHPFLRDLPSIIHIKKNAKKHEYLQNLILMILAETRSEKFASNIVTDRLAEVLFVHLLREYISEQKAVESPWSALSQPKIYRSLQMIHSDIASAWTLNIIAREIGMSRSLFALRFHESVGLTPMRYITEWRFHKAKDLLKQTDLSIGVIAHRVGYISEPAFNRAFKRNFEQTPGNYRKISV